MKLRGSIRRLVRICAALSLAACNAGDLSVELPGQSPDRTLDLAFPPGEAVEHALPFRISGGQPPYVSRIEGCPDWATHFSHQGILAGTAPASDRGRTFFCTYIVTDSGTLTVDRRGKVTPYRG